MTAVPGVDAVRLALQVAMPTVALEARVHGEPVKLPRLVEKTTVPPGVIGLPIDEESVTVAVQSDA